jgi:hypothetical protein
MKLREHVRLFLRTAWRRWNRQCPHDGSTLELWPQGFADWELRCMSCGYKRDL